VAVSALGDVLESDQVEQARQGLGHRADQRDRVLNLAGAEQIAVYVPRKVVGAVVAELEPVSAPVCVGVDAEVPR